jgi:hypothetical protein
MQQQLHRFFLGAVGFGFVVVWATLGATDAVLAVLVCLAAANARLLLGVGVERAGRRKPKPARERRPRLTARSLEDEGEWPQPHPLVPDDPSLVLTTYPS